jgi:hypothetical protein
MARSIQSQGIPKVPEQQEAPRRKAVTGTIECSKVRVAPLCHSVEEDHMIALYLLYNVLFTRCCVRSGMNIQKIRMKEEQNTLHNDF